MQILQFYRSMQILVVPLAASLQLGCHMVRKGVRVCEVASAYQVSVKT